MAGWTVASFRSWRFLAARIAIITSIEVLAKFSAASRQLIVSPWRQVHELVMPVRGRYRPHRLPGGQVFQEHLGIRNCGPRCIAHRPRKHRRVLRNRPRNQLGILRRGSLRPSGWQHNQPQNRDRH